MPYSSEQLLFYGESAQEKVARELGVNRFLREYASMPEFAGGELFNLLEDLPRIPNKVDFDAFVAWEIIRQTHQCIRGIVEEGSYFRQLLEQENNADAWKGNVGNALADLDAYCHEQGRDTEDRSAISRAAEDRDYAVNWSFRRALNGNDDHLPIHFHYGNMDPRACYRHSTETMAKGICDAVTGGSRLEPLFTNGVINPQTVEEICRQTLHLVTQLPYDDGGDQEQGVCA